MSKKRNIIIMTVVIITKIMTMSIIKNMANAMIHIAIVMTTTMSVMILIVIVIIMAMNMALPLLFIIVVVRLIWLVLTSLWHVIGIRISFVAKACVILKRSTICVTSLSRRVSSSTLSRLVLSMLLCLRKSSCNLWCVTQCYNVIGMSNMATVCRNLSSSVSISTAML